MASSRILPIPTCLLAWACSLPLLASLLPRSATDVAWHPDGKRIVVLDATTREVVLFDATSKSLESRIALEGSPRGAVWSPNGQSLYVSEFGAGQIAHFDGASGKRLRTIECGRYPTGLALLADQDLLLAADWGKNELTVVDLKGGGVRARIPVGCQPTAVTATPDGSLAVVTALLPVTAATAPDHAADVTLVDLKTLKARTRIRLPLGSTAVQDVAISPDGCHAFVTHVVGRFNLPTTQLDRGWINTNAVSVIDLKEARLTGTLLLDQVMLGAADPWGVAVHPSRPLLYVSLSGIHQVAVIQLEALHKLVKERGDELINDLAALQQIEGIERIPLPLKGPRGLAIAPDGGTLAVAGYFSGNLVLAGADLSAPVSLSLGQQPEPDPARQGEFVFHDASHCFQTWLSCATCHPDARVDGLNWDLLNDGIGNSKNTKTMLLAHETPPMMSLGVRSDMPTAVRAGFMHIQFSQPDPQRVEQVGAYLSSLEPLPSPHLQRDGSLTPAALRGKTLYESRAVGCAFCHPAPLFTRNKMADVGTSGPSDQGATRFDTPMLHELWRTPPYLHHGEATTIREVLTTHNKQDKHGKTSHLSTAELDDLEAYLLTL